MTICIDKFEPADMHLPVAQPPAVRFMRRKISDFARRGRIIELAESFPNRLLEFRASSPDGAFFFTFRLLYGMIEGFWAVDANLSRIESEFAVS